MAITEIAWNALSSDDGEWLELHCRAGDGREKFFGCVVYAGLKEAMDDLRGEAALWETQPQPSAQT